MLFRAHSDYFVTHEQSGFDMHPFFSAGKDLFINLSLLSANNGHERYITTFKSSWQSYRSFEMNTLLGLGEAHQPST